MPDAAPSGCSPLNEPVIVTRAGVIIDGYRRWQDSVKRGHSALPCLEYDIDDAAALETIIWRYSLCDKIDVTMSSDTPLTVWTSPITGLFGFRVVVGGASLVFGRFTRAA